MSTSVQERGCKGPQNGNESKKAELTPEVIAEYEQIAENIGIQWVKTHGLMYQELEDLKQAALIKLIRQRPKGRIAIIAARTGIIDWLRIVGTFNGTRRTRKYKERIIFEHLNGKHETEDKSLNEGAFLLELEAEIIRLEPELKPWTIIALRLRLGMDQGGRERKLKRIGEIMGVTENRISQLMAEVREILGGKKKKAKPMMITAFGETKSVSEWSRDPRAGACARTIKDRIRVSKWAPERAITEAPNRNFNPKGSRRRSNGTQQK